MSQELEQKNNNSEQGLSTSDQLDHFKSLYYLLKGKRDTDIKLFDGYKQFRHRDIVELNDKVYKKLSLHQLVTETNSVVVSLSNKEIKTFGNWLEFLKFDWNISATTNYITIEWDFNLILPNQTHLIPQTHSLRVRIGSGLRPNEMIQVLFQGGEETDLEEAQAQVVCKIDFVNAQISSELKTIVMEWYAGLSNNSEDHKLIKFILKHKVKIQQSVIVLFLISGIIVLNFLTHYFISNIPDGSTNELLTRFYLITTCSFVAIYIFYISGSLYADRILNKRIRRFNRNPIFEFTKGDENKLINTEKKNAILLKKLFLDLTIAILINILAFGIGKLFPTILEMIEK
jgi:hypothetical protein